MSRRKSIDAEWIPAAFLLPTFLLAAAVAVIEDAREAFGDTTEAGDQDEEAA